MCAVTLIRRRLEPARLIILHSCEAADLNLTSSCGARRLHPVGPRSCYEPGLFGSTVAKTVWGRWTGRQKEERSERHESCGGSGPAAPQVLRSEVPQINL